MTDLTGIEGVEDEAAMLSNAESPDQCLDKTPEENSVEALDLDITADGQSAEFDPRD